MVLAHLKRSEKIERRDTMVKKERITLLALNGFLGYGYREESLEAGFEAKPDVIGVDAGSNDPGPYYLGSGETLVRESQVYRDLKPALPRAVREKIPFIIGTAGTAGGEPHLKGLLRIIERIAGEEKLTFTMAVIPSEIDRQKLVAALEEDRIEATPGGPSITRESILGSDRIVGQMGTAPIIEALQRGADVVVAGRACDTAIYASYPRMLGYSPGLALHMAKILECGALCAVPAAANDCLLGVLEEDRFIISTLTEDRKVTPESVAAHTLYEQSHPMRLIEPEGLVDLSGCSFSQLDERSVEVKGSTHTPHEAGTTIKLEGARCAGYRSITLAGVRDRGVIAHLDEIEQRVRENVKRNHAGSGGRETEDAYQLHFRYYGRDAVLGDREPLRAKETPYEVGVLIEAIADDPETSASVLSLARSNFLHTHFQGRKTTAGNAAFPFSPSDIACGPVYDFSIYHILKGEDWRDLFPIEFREVKGD